MKTIKKLSSLQLKEITTEMQKTITGGMSNEQFCLEKYGPCPEGTIYTYKEGNCYCTPVDIGPGGGPGSGSGGGSRPDCSGAGKYCFPSDGCSSFLGTGTMLANNL